MRISKLFDLKKDAEGRKVMEVSENGISLLRLVLTNKGTAFSPEERVALKLDGLLPPQVNTLEQQVARVYLGYCQETTPLGRYQFLRNLQERQEVLFYALLEKHLGEMMPIVYTPTVGAAVQNFSALYQHPRGISLSPLNIDRAREALDNYPLDDVRMIVATDSSAILGIGDQGYGGLAIPIGKLALYTVGGGVSPFHTMPVALDVGTERTDLINDPYYLGVRQRRMSGDEYFDFLDRFVDAVHARYPRAVIQWEDLSKEAAFSVLERYRKKHVSFNDDVQGTGAVALSGVISACHVKGEKLTDQKVIVYGAGAGGMGVAIAIRDGMIQAGLTREEATSRVFVLDSKGLLVTTRQCEDYKRPFAFTPESIAHWKVEGSYPTLLETIKNSGASVLLGLSGQPGTFGEDVIRAMAANVERPIIFPLSNPTTSCEAQPEDIIKWTNGRALVATGSPFEPVEFRGKTYPVGQGNNAFIFPGLGFGAILSDASEITDGMVAEAANALAEYTIRHYAPLGLIFPPITELRDASVYVTERVIQQAIKDGVTTKKMPAELDQYVRDHFWHPEYVPFVRAKDAR